MEGYTLSGGTAPEKTTPYLRAWLSARPSLLAKRAPSLAWATHGVLIVIGLVVLVSIVAAALVFRPAEGASPTATPDAAVMAVASPATTPSGSPARTAAGPSARPTRGLLSGVKAVSAGYAHSCALLGGGTVKCWGANNRGQLGDGATTESSTPVTVVGLSGVTAISAGSDHSCAVLGDGSVKCWGADDIGQLGDGAKADSSTPVDVSGLSGATAVAAGEYHSCALLADGTVKCWGNYAELGQNRSNYDSSTAVNVSGLSGVTAISAGDMYTCALLADRTVKCWGVNYFGQFGDGTTTNSSTPVGVSGLSGVAAISMGGMHSCALLGDGTMKCWGWNNYGQLGDGTTNLSPASSTPVSVFGLSGVIAISAGGLHSCALLGDGTVRCWGLNWYGQLGYRTASLIDTYSTPGNVAGLAGVTAISMGGLHSCALLVDGTLRCWGNNNGGELGEGTHKSSIVPGAVVE
jgi:alpha-tubulin suppressor-like RCC1 family protein